MPLDNPIFLALLGIFVLITGYNTFDNHRRLKQAKKDLVAAKKQAAKTGRRYGEKEND